MVLLLIYLNENDRWGHHPLHEGIAQLLTAHGVGGVTVLRGIAGTGAHGSWHTERILELSSSLPLILEAIAPHETISPLIPELETMLKGGLITLIPLTVIGSGGNPPPPQEGRP
jgi:PII-like signaling protein